MKGKTMLTTRKDPRVNRFRCRGKFVSSEDFAAEVVRYLSQFAAMGYIPVRTADPVLWAGGPSNRRPTKSQLRAMRNAQLFFGDQSAGKAAGEI